MYSGRGFEASELGDVDVFCHEGMFHLFHLVLPNHDYIAHAVSRDGFLWRRVKNALFIGEPGDWDDDMLWTMHVSRDPDWPSSFRMFYTGISRKEDGRIQRIGLARSNDLYYWEKVSSADYPLTISGPDYESSVEEGRHWVSCRDPFFYMEGSDRYLLVNARSASGPVIRRGCVGLARETAPDTFIWERPLFFPRMYDDIEVPGVIPINGNYYLIGNIKEDIKIHYWKADNLLGAYEAFASNVLLPRGNYAARITRDSDRYLLWNFYTDRSKMHRSTILPPPTELQVAEDGQLYLTSYGRFSEKVQQLIPGEELFPMRKVLANDTAAAERLQDGISLSSVSGYEIFYFHQQATDFRLSFTLGMSGKGKTGIVFRADEQANGNYISLDVIHGLAQGRVWGYREQGGIENAFQYGTVQGNRFPPLNGKDIRIEIVVFGGYVELSVDSRIILRYVETSYMDQSSMGIYVESAVITLQDIVCETLDGPQEEDHQVL